ncbi:MAG TPA: HAMP domain-containing sensor histidine kinase [Candidatus Saccharibacteria bacterium]|nr:HAMP domain-containing sensor histidine kinase [Candidatus Saccharibacteria bacterium]
MKRPFRLNIFESATLRLAAWYVLLLMTLSIVFSVVLFLVASNEFNRVLAPRGQGEVRIFVETPMVEQLRERRISDSTARLTGSLVLFNVGVLLSGGAFAYVLARRTLRPIEEAHNAQARFASDAAHELRTPLAVMQTEMEVSLRDKKTTKTDYEHVLRSSLEEVERLRNLADRLLQLASQQELQLTAVDIEAASIEALDRAVPLAQAKNIAIENTVGKLTATGHFDSVVAVLGILLDNAIKYSPPGTSVRLYASATEKSIDLSVADQGHGIAQEEQAKIFERFYRVDLSRSSENVPGHGLGLSLAKRLVDDMRGELGVVSKPGEGSTFTVSLPKLVQ